MSVVSTRRRFSGPSTARRMFSGRLSLQAGRHGLSWRRPGFLHGEAGLRRDLHLAPQWRKGLPDDLLADERPVHFGGVEECHAPENLANAGALLFGRVTYEMMEAA
jgi:hypothetical protein